MVAVILIVQFTNIRTVNITRCLHGEMSFTKVDEHSQIISLSCSGRDS